MSTRKNRTASGVAALSATLVAVALASPAAMTPARAESMHGGRLQDCSTKTPRQRDCSHRAGCTSTYTWIPRDGWGQEIAYAAGTPCGGAPTAGGACNGNESKGDNCGLHSPDAPEDALGPPILPPEE